MDYYTLTREQVASILNVSTRTLDRYVAKNIFSTQRKKGKIFFHSKEIGDFKQEQNTESIDISFDNQSVRLRQIQNNFSEQFPGEIQEKSLSKDVSKVEMHDNQIELQQIAIEAELYKKMYASTQEMLQAQTTRLEQAYYRIGELEYSLKSSVPLLESKTQKEELQKTLQLQQNTIHILEKEAIQKNEEAKTANLMKLVYFITTLISIVIFSFLLVIL